CATFLYW
nr:immunoglobulin heavy chain junction region [Macaca mulatta]MOV54568.1 immunoglobulin heavy chain junction region [Macaca mulatta]MOV55041.1 immunoglobulin heavy chain junction region [Macaca mulatta]MOV55624.1 immunoglobulin heavy chain junction region [Macaca mulatta]MOV55806.1 immunoglobulin heavy chain junction region [Macaca mulatta]